MFGVACGVVVPFGDLCLGLPNTGEVCFLSHATPRHGRLRLSVFDPFFCSTIAHHLYHPFPCPSTELDNPVAGPNAMQDPTPWLITFAPDLRIQSVDPVLRRLHTDCMVLTNKNNPSLWSVAGYSERDVLNFFEMFNVSKKVPAHMSDPILAVSGHTKPFTDIKVRKSA